MGWQGVDELLFVLIVVMTGALLWRVRVQPAAEFPDRPTCLLCCGIMACLLAVVLRGWLF
jgi:hypothetical protein